MRPDVAARLNGVKKTLADVLVTLVDVPVLAKSRAVHCLPNEIVEVSSVKGFHNCSAHQAVRAETI